MSCVGLAFSALVGEMRVRELMSQVEVAAYTLALVIDAVLPDRNNDQIRAKIVRAVNLVDVRHEHQFDRSQRSISQLVDSLLPLAVARGVATELDAAWYTFYRSLRDLRAVYR